MRQDVSILKPVTMQFDGNEVNRNPLYEPPAKQEIQNQQIEQEGQELDSRRILISKVKLDAPQEVSIQEFTFPSSQMTPYNNTMAHLQATQTSLKKQNIQNLPNNKTMGRNNQFYTQTQFYNTKQSKGVKLFEFQDNLLELNKNKNNQNRTFRFRGSQQKLRHCFRFVIKQKVFNV
eukprot:403361064